MNADPKKTKKKGFVRRAAIPLGCLGTGLLIASVAGAQNAVDEWATPITDPLRTLSPALKPRISLPGDSEPWACHDQIPASAQLSLIDAIDLALCHNPQVKSAWANIKVQAAGLGEARAAYLPSVVASGSHMRDKTTYPSSYFSETTINNLSGNIGVNWRLFDFGGRRANLRAGEYLLQAAMASRDAVLQKTLATVISAYSDVQTSRENWQTREKNEALLREIIEITERREAKGISARTDTLQAKTALAKATLEKNRAKGAYDKAKAVLIYSLGLPPSTQVELNNDVSNAIDMTRQDLQQWLDDTEKRHPAIVAGKLQVEAAKQKLVVTRAEGMPTLDFSGNYYENGRPSQGASSIRSKETVIGFTVTVPIFSGFSQTYKVRGAQAQLEQKEQELQDTEHQILGEVIKAHAEAVASLNNLDASQQLLSAADEALSSVKRKFDRGAADLLEILNAQSALLDAQQERIRCQSEWRSARLVLLANSGMLGREYVREGSVVKPDRKSAAY